ADFPQFLGVIETTHHKLLSVRRGENSRYRRPLPNVGNAGVAVSNNNPKIARGRFRPALLRRRSNMPSISWSYLSNDSEPSGSTSLQPKKSHRHRRKTVPTGTHH